MSDNMGIADMLVVSAVVLLAAYAVLGLDAKRRVRKYRPNTSPVVMQPADLSAIKIAVESADSDEERKRCRVLLVQLRVTFVTPLVAFALLLSAFVIEAVTQMTAGE